MMNQQNNNLTCANNAERFELADLPVADEQADAVCGGAEQIDRPRPPGGTGFVNNHNETASQDEEDCAAFTELSLTDEELDGIKGGPLCHGVSVLGWARVDGVSPMTNHNETVMSDEVAGMEELADLPLTVAQAEGAKAGIAGGTSAAAGEIPYIISFQDTASGNGAALHLKPLTNELSSNHNETVAADDATGTDPLADLPVEDTEQIRGGSIGNPPATGKTLTGVLLGK